MNALQDRDPMDENQPPKGVCSFCGAWATGSICAKCDALYEAEASEAYEQGERDG